MSNVFLVKKKDTGEAFAMKSISKELVIQENVMEGTRLEQEILLKVIILAICCLDRTPFLCVNAVRVLHREQINVHHELYQRR